MLKVSGAPGSPYTRKMLAVLRYRRIPHRFVIRGSKEDADTPAPKVPVIPVITTEDGEAMVDSTPMIRRLESEWPGRPLLPADPALRLVDALLEDYGDEWVTKAMFHYRWVYADDIRFAGEVLPAWRGIAAPPHQLEEMSRYIRDRQIGRLGVVGSNPVTGPVIEASYRRLLALLGAHLAAGHPFLLGQRPGGGDFGIWGQITQLVLFDPTPSAIARADATRVYAWCQLLEDLSGLEPGADDAGWIDPALPPPTLRAVLAEVGRVYAPYLLANAAALERGAERVELTLDGHPWVSDPFRYQGRCLAELRNDYHRLDSADRARVDALLAGSGCEVLFA